MCAWRRRSATREKNVEVDVLGLYDVRAKKKQKSVSERPSVSVSGNLRSYAGSNFFLWTQAQFHYNNPNGVVWCGVDR